MITRNFSFLVLLLVSQWSVESTTVHVLPFTSNKKTTVAKAPSTARGGSMDISPKLFRRFADDSRMPSLFLPEESIYDRYAACLAATEGLRRIRDRDLAEEMRELGFRRPVGGPSEAEKNVNAQYIQNSGKVVRALGMTVKQFNELGRQISKDEKLKDKVMEQAYLYRLAATISMDRMPLIEDPAATQMLRSSQRDKVDLFCESMSEIEKLRESQIDRLKRSLRVENLPSHVTLSDPGLLPFLSPKVRAVVEAFPYQAEEIVKKYGLESSEFNEMLEETRNNPIFRWKIQKHLQKVGQGPTQAPADEELNTDSFGAGIRVNR